MGNVFLFGIWLYALETSSVTKDSKTCSVAGFLVFGVSTILVYLYISSLKKTSDQASKTI